MFSSPAFPLACDQSVSSRCRKVEEWEEREERYLESCADEIDIRMGDESIHFVQVSTIYGR